MAIGLIPRVRVNYSIKSCLCSLFVSEKSDRYRIIAQKLLSDYFEGRPVLLTAAGRGALYYIFKSLPQKKVMIPAYTCTVVAEAALYAGKEIIYVPLSNDQFNADNYNGMDNNTIVVATHQYGYSCDIKQIAEKCKYAGAILIEDCAAAIGTKVDGKKVGTFGDFAILSFNHSKQLTLPRGGGCIVARNLSQMENVKHQMNLVYDKARTKKNKRFALICLLLNNSIIYKLYHKYYVNADQSTEIHYDVMPIMDRLYIYQMDEWQAYLLIPQIKQISKLSEKRKAIFSYYQNNIHNDKIIKPQQQEEADYSRYVIQIKNGCKCEFYKKCVQAGVDLDFSHSHLTCPATFKREYSIAKSVLNLPFYYKLSMREVRRIVKIINGI